MVTRKNQSTKVSSSIKETNQCTTSKLDSFTCLWLDETVDSTQDNLTTQQELRQVINHLQTFSNSDECEQYIRQVTQEKIVLIVSGALGRQVIPRLHDSPQLLACYIFCQEKKANEQWANKYHKINGVFVESAQLVAQISKDKILRAKVKDCAPVLVISTGSQSLQARNAIFMWFQLFIEVLLRMHHKSTDRKDLIDICKSSYKGNPQEIEIIDEFEKNYKPENAIWWYTRESCFYRMMNKALRVQDFDMLFALRFFITDISKQIKNEYDKFIRTSETRDIIRVYRGQVIGIDELELMKNSIGEFLSMNSFLSTSRNRSTAVHFAQQTPITDITQRIIFEIEIDPRLQTKAFADISSISYFQNEDEVLIMLGALFRIEKVVEATNDRVWVVYVSLASEDDYHLKETFSYMKETIGDDTDLDSLGKILLEMGEPEQARKCYQKMLDEGNLIVGNAESGLAMAYLDCNREDESLDHLEKALQIRQSVLGSDHADVGECYSHIGTVHWWVRRDNEQALINLIKGMKIQEKTLPPDSLPLAKTYGNVATTYGHMKEFDLALEYYSKCLKIQQTVLPLNHPSIATTYNNLGLMLECKRCYLKALDYYQKSLDIKRKTLPPTHVDVIRTENNIRSIRDNIRILIRDTPSGLKCGAHIC